MVQNQKTRLLVVLYLLLGVRLALLSFAADAEMGVMGISWSLPSSSSSTSSTSSSSDSSFFLAGNGVPLVVRLGGPPDSSLLTGGEGVLPHPKLRSWPLGRVYFWTHCFGGFLGPLLHTSTMSQTITDIFTAPRRFSECLSEYHFNGFFLKKGLYDFWEGFLRD